MDPIFSAVNERLEAMHGDIDQVLSGLPLEALDWVPGEGMNSIAVLAAHVAGSERYWVGELAGGRPAGRVREAEFQTRGVGEEALRSALAESLALSQAVLSGLSVADLETLRENPVWGKQVSIAVCLAHTLEHIGTHLGHMQITRQMWEQAVR
jgi:uncharacterized damage-inducible protein DinB